jgi:hypothetical protein
MTFGPSARAAGSLATALLLLVLGAAAPARSADDAKLSPQKYSDKLAGFSLRPPLETEQIKEPSSSCVVRWVSRDAKTSAVVWSVGVNAVTEAKRDANKPDLSLKEYSKALVATLKAQEGLEANSVEVTLVDGKGAIDIRGTTVALSTFWRRQVWVLAEPGRFLIFWVSGPIDDKDHLDALLGAVLATIKTFDPLEVLKAEEANLLRGRLLLATIPARKLAPAEAEQWFLFRQDGKAVGWTLQMEELGRQEKHNGLAVKTLTMLRLPKDQLRLSKRTLFASPDGFEQWQETLAVGEAPTQTVIEETGLRQEGMIVCTVAQGVRQQSHKKAVPFDPNEPREMYLPRAIGAILPRLIDLSKPVGYSFASYSSQDNKFKLRTITVIGPDKITLAGRQIDAIHLTDVEEANEESASDLWVDAKGMPLRIKGPGWPDIETSTRDEIVIKIPEASKVIKEALGK